MNSRNAERGPIVIRIAIEKQQPLTGRATAAGGEQLRFEGWLGLLSVLSKLVGSTSETGNRSEEPPDNEF